MDLKDFVRETLSQITEGVREAQDGVQGAGGFVNPAFRPSKINDPESHFGLMPDGQNIFMVNFDVAVSVVEGTQTDADARLQVAGFIKLGAGGASEESATTTNRVSFKVPLALPVDTVSAEGLKEKDERKRKKREAETRAVDEFNRGGHDSWMR